MEQSNNKFKVSILVPIYNVELFIERCTLSLFDQTMSQDIEYVFVNDCSTDRSVKLLNEIIERYPKLKKNIKIISHLKNKGLACARETALMNATGKYLLTVDSDDWIELDMVENLYRATNNSTIDVVSCDYYIEYRKKNRIIVQNVGTTPLDCLHNIFLGNAHGGTCFRLIKRSIYIENNIHYFEGINMLEDISVLHKVLLNAKTIKHINNPYYHYFQGNTTSYSTKLSHNSKKNMISLVPIIEEQLKLYNCEKKVWNSFCVFKLRIKSLLIENSTSINEIRSYNNLYNEISIDKNRRYLSLKERLLLRHRHIDNIGIYIIIQIISKLKEFRNVLIN